MSARIHGQVRVSESKNEGVKKEVMERIREGVGEGEIKEGLKGGSE